MGRRMFSAWLAFLPLLSLQAVVWDNAHRPVDCNCATGLNTVCAENLSVLLVSDCPMPLPETAAALKQFAENGGTLLFDVGFDGKTAAAAAAASGFSGKSLELTRDVVKLSSQLREIAKEYGMFPPVEVLGADGMPVYGVEWAVAETEDGRSYLYIANMSKQKMKLQVRGAALLQDVRNGGTWQASYLEQPFWETFVGTWKYLKRGDFRLLPLSSENSHGYPHSQV